MVGKSLDRNLVKNIRRVAKTDIKIVSQTDNG